MLIDVAFGKLLFFIGSKLVIGYSKVREIFDRTSYTIPQCNCFSFILLKASLNGMVESIVCFKLQIFQKKI